MDPMTEYTNAVVNPARIPVTRNEYGMNAPGLLYDAITASLCIPPPTVCVKTIMNAVKGPIVLTRPEALLTNSVGASSVPTHITSAFVDFTIPLRRGMLNSARFII
jgi:hypothetical protein